uniref:Putative ribonuclease H-like domain-containing protein n=1 Tax=Tanacetum cinerariifolium TaxID=118510 RepID=A0A6L2JL56_TANCI|nr:putative ribonuclease H-like domain-containing protein [Tanacetum cinerariifolium]
MTRHTTEQCFELIGYPNWWNDGHKKGNKNRGPERGKASAANTDTDRESPIGFEGMVTTTINEEDGSFLMSTTQNYNINKKQSWIFDRGATNTMTYDLSDFATSTKPTKSYIHAANGEKINYIRTGAIIGRGTERQGLYYVDEVTRSGTVMLSHGTAEREAWLWHRRLGIHPLVICMLYFPSYFLPIHSGQGERECIDTLSWLKYVTYEEGRNHSTQPEDPNISVAQEAPNLIPEVSNTHSSPISEHVETTNNTSGQDTSERYALPPIANQGVLSKRYSPEKMSRGSRYLIANIAKGNLSEEAKSFALSMSSDEIPANTKQALKSNIRKMQWKKK